MQHTMQALAKPETIFEVTSLTGETLKFRLIHWSPTKVFSRISLVGRYFAVPISMLIGSKPGDEDFSDIIPGALLQLFGTMDENNVVSFVHAMLDDVYYNNEKVVDNFDKIFVDKSDVVIALIAKVVEIHYAPFMKTGLNKFMTSIMSVIGLERNN